MAAGANVTMTSGGSQITAASPSDIMAQNTAAAIRNGMPHRPVATRAAQARGGAEQQHPGHAAADRRLGQRDVDGKSLTQTIATNSP